VRSPRITLPVASQARVSRIKQNWRGSGGDQAPCSTWVRKVISPTTAAMLACTVTMYLAGFSASLGSIRTYWHCIASGVAPEVLTATSYL